MAFGSSRSLRSLRFATAAVAIVTSLLVFAPPAALAAPGDLDPTFSGDGRVELPFAGDGAPIEIAVQPDGKVVTVGSPDFQLRRVRANGRRDPSFGESGSVTTTFPGYDFAGAVALQPDGRILVAGGADGNFALARYLPDGTLDDSFSGDGRVVTDLGGGAGAVALQPDGKIVAAGTGSEGGFALVRLNADGSLDDSFSDDGETLIGVGDGASGVAVAPGGDIVVAGPDFDETIPAPGEQVAVARLDPDGTPDPSFSGDGILVAQYARKGDLVSDVAVQPDGKIVIGGTGVAPVPHSIFGRIKFELIRLSPDGALDPAFSGGVVRTLVGHDSYGRAFSLQPDGKIVMAGESDNAFALARYNGDGSLDDSFSEDGKLLTDFSDYPRYTRNTQATDVALGPDGKIVAGGIVKFESSWVLSRYKAAAGPGDADADGVLDAEDLCPSRFGYVEGCRHFRRSLTIRYADRFDEFRGELTGRNFYCKSHQRVTLFQRRPGHDRVIGRDWTDFESSGGAHYVWEVSLFRPHGRYYARVKRHVLPSYGICGRARSEILDLG
jgi:uncharacterized delta-60 repeat protein